MSPSFPFCSSPPLIRVPNGSGRTSKRSGRFTLQITSKGFQFLLEDRLAQIWQVLMYYVGVKTVRTSLRYGDRMALMCAVGKGKTRRGRWCGDFKVVFHVGQHATRPSKLLSSRTHASHTTDSCPPRHTPPRLFHPPNQKS